MQEKHGRHSAAAQKNTEGRETRRAAAPQAQPPRSARTQTPRPATSDENWDLGPEHLFNWNRMGKILRVAMACLFVFAVCFFWPHFSDTPIATAVATPNPNGHASRPARLDTYETPVLVAATPRPTASDSTVGISEAELQQKLDAAAKAAGISQQELERLEAEKDNDDPDDVLFSDAADYFGSDDVLLTFYDILEDATPTPVPTAVPTPTLAPGETPDPNATPTPEPTQAPVISGPVLTGNSSAACVQAYNSWDESLKNYTYQMAQAYDLQYEMLLAIIYHESRFQPGLTHLNNNKTTDWGLMQINDVCFSALQRWMGIGSMSDLLDSYKGIQAGCAILAYHQNAIGKTDEILLRYQVGEGAYAKYKALGAASYPATYTNTLALRDAFVAAGI